MALCLFGGSMKPPRADEQRTVSVKPNGLLKLDSGIEEAFYPRSRFRDKED